MNDRFANGMATRRAVLGDALALVVMGSAVLAGSLLFRVRRGMQAVGGQRGTV